MTPYSEVQWYALETQLEDLIRERTAIAGSLFVRTALATMRMDFVTFSKLRTRLLATGRVADLGRGLGLATVGSVQPRVGLSGLVLTAQARLDLESQGRGGRPRSGATDAPTSLSMSQFKKIRTVAAFLETTFANDTATWVLRGPYNRNPLSREWNLLTYVEAADAFRALSTVTRTAYSSALRSALAINEAAGLTGGVLVTDQPWMLAAEWAPWASSSAEHVSEGAQPLERERYGVRQLAIAAARENFLPESTEWERVHAAIERRVTAGILSRESARTIRRMYRRLLDADLISGPAWGAGTGAPTSLVTTATQRGLVLTGDYSSVVSRSGTILSGFARDLKRFHLWRARASSMAALRAVHPPLPPRTFTEGRKTVAPYLIEPSTIKRIWQTFFDHAGFLVSRGFVSEHDIRLEDLINRDAWTARMEDVCKAQDISPDDGRSHKLHTLALALAVLADPYLAAESQHGLTQSDESTLKSLGDFYRAESDRFEPEVDDIIGVREKIAAWEADGTAGYPKLGKLRDLLSAEAIRFAHDLPLSEQLDALRDGCLVLYDRQLWACAVRDAVMISVLRRVPLRAHNLVGIELQFGLPKSLKRGEGRHSAAWQVNDPNAPWAGPITLAIGSRRSKSRHPKELPLITTFACGDADAEAHLGRTLLELYLRPGGARDVLLGDCAGWTRVKHVIVGDASKAQDKIGGVPGTWSSAAATMRFHNLMRRHTSALGLNFEAMAPVTGACGIHVIRHLFGSWWVEHNRPKFAAEMLLHSSTEALDVYYTHMTPRALSIDAQMSA